MKAAAVMGLLAGVLTGCAALPTAGPTARQIVHQKVENSRPRFDLVDIDDNVVAALRAASVDNFADRFEQHGKPPPHRIAIGDNIVVSIWEAAGGGLFSGGDADGGVTSGSRNVTIPQQAVGQDGGVSVPFAGRIPIAGLLPLEAQQAIQLRLAKRRLSRRSS
jgi:polysaccharide biosynthesis/export protein